MKPKADCLPGGPFRGGCLKCRCFPFLGGMLETQVFSLSGRMLETQVFSLSGRMLETQVLSLSGGPFWHGAGTRGKALKVAKPVFPPRAPPFRARSCCRLWNYVKILEGRWILLRWQWKVEPIYADVNILAKRFFKLRSARKAVCKANLFLNNSYTPQSRKQACYAGSFPIQPETINIAEATNIAEVTNSAEATIGSAGYCRCSRI